MSDFDKNMRLKEKAEEDMYFARRDRERIRALHEQQPGDHSREVIEQQDTQSVTLPEDASVETRARGYATGPVALWLRRLADKVLTRRR